MASWMGSVAGTVYQYTYNSRLQDFTIGMGYVFGIWA